jgi:hypothetical protein
MTNYPNEISTLNPCRASRKCRTPNSQPKFAIESEEDVSGDLPDDGSDTSTFPARTAALKSESRCARITAPAPSSSSSSLRPPPTPTVCSYDGGGGTGEAVAGGGDGFGGGGGGRRGPTAYLEGGGGRPAASGSGGSWARAMAAGGSWARATAARAQARWCLGAMASGGDGSAAARVGSAAG